MKLYGLFSLASIRWFELTLHLKFKSVWIHWTSYQLCWTGESCRFNKGSFPYTQFRFLMSKKVKVP